MAERLESTAFFGLLFAIVWAPWPLGSNRPWAVAVLAVVIWGGICLAATSAAYNATPPRRRLSPASYVPLVGLIGYAGLVVAQLVPGWGQDGGTISIDPFHTRLYLLKSLIYLGGWILIMLTVHSRERAGRLLAAIVAVGVLQAIVAVLLYSSGAHYDFLFTTFDQGGRAMGTFPNPDHLAGYMELCLSAGLGWLLSRLGGGEELAGAGWRTHTVSFLTFMMSGKMLLRLLLVVMVIALVMSHSRMGNGAFFLALVLSGGAVAMASKQLRRPAMWLVASMALVDVIIIGQWVGLDRVVQRLQNTAEASSATMAGFGVGTAAAPQEESLAQRMEVPRLSLKLVAQRPWFGWGGGTYYTALPPFKDANRSLNPLSWDHAHNDYVEVACDTGLIGLALWLSVGVASGFRALRLLRDDQPRMNRGFGAAAMMALSCIGLHSLVDFNLQIPANALTFTVLLAAVWAVPSSPKRRRRSSSPGAAPST